MVKWNGTFRSDRSNREKRSTSKGGPLFSNLFRLDLTDPFSFRPKFPEILIEWIAPIRSRGKTNLTSFPLPVDCGQSLSFPSVFLAFLRASVELLGSERLICIILTKFCARRISGTKTDYS